MNFLKAIPQFILVMLCISYWQPTVHAQGYDIEVDVYNYYNDTLFMANFLMDKQYMVDTAIGENGTFHFDGAESLPGGVYILVFAGYGKYSQFIINPQDQKFSLSLNYEELQKPIKVKGSEDNEIFQEYIGFLSQQTQKVTPLRESIMSARDKGEDTEDLEAALASVDSEVKAYQQRLVKEHPESVSAMLIKSTLEVPFPEFEGSQEEVDEQRYRFFKAHYFDHLDLTNPSMLRTPFLYNKLIDYVEKYTPKHPDSIAVAIDAVLKRMDPQSEAFKYYLVHWLNHYAASKYVGMDGVYVHLVDTYYKTAMATWTEEEQLSKIIKNADELRPTLLGKIAPELPLFELDIAGTLSKKSDEDPLKRVQVKGVRPLSDVNTPYTILIFWEPTCGHCKKEMPKLGELYQKVRDKGVEVYAVCGKNVQEDGMVLCADFLQEHELTEWINAVDPYYRTGFKTTYNIKTTPQVFLLDSDKKILSKRIGVEQLEEILMDLLNNKDQR